MRFGRTLQLATYAPWRESYIDYSYLKKLLRDDESTPSSPSTAAAPNGSGSANGQDTWTDEDEGRFVDELVNVQLEKVHAFHKETYEKLRERTAGCEARLDTVAVALNGSEGQDDQKDGAAESKPKENGEGNGNGEGKKPIPSEAEKKEIMKSVLTDLDTITREVNELEKYSRINYTGFLKAAKKHDRKRGASYRVRPLLQVRLAALPFNREDYSPLLYRLSAMYSFLRQHLEGTQPPRGLSASVSDAGAAMEGREEYASHKFWVHPENLLEVKTMILRRLPVLVYNPQTSKIAEGARPDPSITSIYFDNPAFSLYTDKVDKGEAASLRLRWYGQLNERPEIWVEKKIVRTSTSSGENEDNVASESRFGTKEKYVNQYLHGTYHHEKAVAKLAARSPGAAEELKTSVSEIQDFIKSKELQPVLRANYTRTAFQIPGDDRVRISLDTDLAFIREDALDERPCRDPESWHRTDIDGGEMEFPFTGIRKGEVNRFPFALLEIKVKRESERRTEWIRDIMSSHLVKAAPRFSKFVHGVAVLFEDYVNTFPFWLPEVEVDIRRDPQEAFEAEQARQQKVRDDEFAVGSLLKSQGGGGAGTSVGKSPKLRESLSRKDIISPVGSPAAKANGAAQAHAGLGAGGKGTASAEPTQLHDTAGEPDEDETGTHAHGTSSEQPSGFKSLLPYGTFSTSKYAQARRSGGRVKLPPGVSKPDHWIKDAGSVKVEAKVWLANQRTFIKWQHVSILLATLGVGLYNAAGVDNNVARALALVYTIIAVLTGAWGYGIYMWRVNLIERRSGKDFDAVAGPVVVCIGLIVALVLNFAFKYQAIVQDKNPQEDGAVLSEMVNETRMLVQQHWGDL